MLFKKKPSVVYWLGNNLYLNITNQCSNNCYFCIRNFKKGVGSFNLKLYREPSPKEVIVELQSFINLRNWREIVFCGYGEPTARLDCLLEVSKWIKRYYGKIATLRVDTNGQGYLLNEGREVVEELREAGINKVSISLNAPDKETYNEICRPKFENAFESILTFIEKAKQCLDVEVTAVSLPELDIKRIAELANNLGVPLRIREYIPCFW
ncbi:radical SAM protein [Candidatus Bathyarchaeota archaeon]|nr:radical SAM protein [Candidatus Bathyarchaeota archaeon]